MNYKQFFTTDNKSGWKCVESKLKRRYPDLHSLIIEFNDNAELNKLPFNQKVWHFINQATIIPSCNECKLPVKYKNINLGYQSFCSLKCSNKNNEKILITKKSMIDNYGVDTSFKIPDINQKIRDKNIENYGVDNPFKNDDIKLKIRSTNLEKYGYEIPFQSKEFRSRLFVNNSKIEAKVGDRINAKPRFVYDNREFDLIKDDDIFEIDGDYFHPLRLEEVGLIQINSAINDYNKSLSISNSDNYNLFRVKVSDIKKMGEISVDSLKNAAYLPDYSLSYDQKIVYKEYFKKYIENKGVEKLAEYVPLFLKFVRTFQPGFPYPDSFNKDINIIMKSIAQFDYGKFHNAGTNEFNNNTYVIGCDYLKSIFKSYWQSSYKKSGLSPIDIWNRDDMMMKIIAYRIGVNKAGEVYDFSLKNLVRGISAIRGTVSFFKPIVAAGIYKHYIGNKDNTVVFDPCCGFGGRLLGFKSVYPNGRYVGCEPNKMTYGELIELSERIDNNNHSNIQINNCKLEDYKEEFEYDLCFTSIPYFDLEDYKNGVEYGGFDDWVESFIKPLLKYKRLVINMDYNLCEKLGLIEYIDGWLMNGKSHFSKGGKDKREVLVKMNF